MLVEDLCATIKYIQLVLPVILRNPVCVQTPQVQDTISAHAELVLEVYAPPATKATLAAFDNLPEGPLAVFKSLVSQCAPDLGELSVYAFLKVTSHLLCTKSYSECAIRCDISFCLSRVRLSSSSEISCKKGTSLLALTGPCWWERS